MGPTYKIAELLKISYREAVAYCEEVRAKSGLGAALHYKTIAQHLAQHRPESPSSQRLAEIITKNKLSSAPVKKSKPKKVKPSLPPKTPKLGVPRRSRIKRRSYERPEKPALLPSYLVRTSHLDRERVSKEKMEHCPHGVPKGRVCAICDPNKFREMTGID